MDQGAIKVVSSFRLLITTDLCCWQLFLKKLCQNVFLSLAKLRWNKIQLLEVRTILPFLYSFVIDHNLTQTSISTGIPFPKPHKLKIALQFNVFRPRVRISLTKWPYRTLARARPTSPRDVLEFFGSFRGVAHAAGAFTTLTDNVKLVDDMVKHRWSLFEPLTFEWVLEFLIYIFSFTQSPFR